MFPNALPSSHRFELCIVAGAWGSAVQRQLSGFTRLVVSIPEIVLNPVPTEVPVSGRRGWDLGWTLGVTQSCKPCRFTVALEPETVSIAVSG